MSWTKEEIDQASQELMKKAMKDEQFRVSLLKDPVAAIENLTGKKIPEGYTIKVIDQDPAYNTTLLLPPLSNDELTADDLDAVAGGDYCMIVTCKADQCFAHKDK